MPNINQLNAANQLSGADLVPIWSQANGDSRKLSLTDLLGWINGEAEPDEAIPQFPPVITEATGARLTAAGDAGSYVRFTFVGAKTYTVAPQTTVVWDDDVEIHGRNAAATDLTLLPGSGVTINVPFGGTLLIPEGGTFTLKRVAMNEWDLIGQTVAV